MNTFELFCLVFYALDAVWDENKNEELGHYLSNANPFLFKDIGSANPEVYEYFRMMIPAQISLDRSFDVATEYISTLGSTFISNAFQSVGRTRWEECAKAYLSSPHKGESTLED